MNSTVLYVSSLCSAKMEKELFAFDPNGVGMQIQKYHRLLAHGLYKNGVAVTALSYQKNIQEITEKERECDGKICYHYVKAFRNRCFAHVSVVLKALCKTWKLLRNNKEMFVICDVLNLSVATGAMLAARILRREIIGIVTDFPEMLNGKMPVRKSPYWWLIDRCTGYVLLTEHMKEYVRVSGKKQIVLEGHVDAKMQQKENLLENKMPGIHCIYAGGIHKKYGIEKLVKSFIQAAVPDSVLHIYGDGDYAEELKRLNSVHIVYHGVVPNSEVVEAELKATLLINPRPTDEEFTKYSFPSKNMEYMVSGTPVLTTCLPGMPQEYEPCVYLFEDETIEGMSTTLKCVLNKSKKELHEKGEEARKFVLKNKNNIVQAQRILDMIKG